MPSTSVAVHAGSQPATAPQAPKPARALRVDGKVKAAIELMIYEGKPFNEAAQAVKYPVGSMRRALERPHVIKYLREQKQVFRASASAANISALVMIRDKSGNAMAQLGAIKTLEQLDEDAIANPRHQALPGLQIVIVQGSNQSSIDARLTQAAPVTINNDDIST